MAKRRSYETLEDTELDEMTSVRVETAVAQADRDIAAQRSTPSVSWRRAETKAREVDRTLLASDQRFNGAVRVSCGDGTVLFYRYAFALVWTDPDGREWLFLFTEHHGFHVFARDELTGFQFEGYGRTLKIDKI